MRRRESSGSCGWEEGQQLTLSLQLLNVRVSQEKVPVVNQLQDLQNCGSSANILALSTGSR